MSSATDAVLPAAISVVLGAGSGVGVTTYNQSTLEKQVAECNVSVQVIRAQVDARFDGIVKDVGRLEVDLGRLELIQPRSKLSKEALRKR